MSASRFTPEQLAELRDYFDNTDQSDAIEAGVVVTAPIHHVFTEVHSDGYRAGWGCSCGRGGNTNVDLVDREIDQHIDDDDELIRVRREEVA